MNKKNNINQFIRSISTSVRALGVTTKLTYVLLSMLFITGIITRISNFKAWPVALYWDEASIALDAISIAESGRDIYGKLWSQPIFLSYGDFKSPVYIWLASLVALVDSNPALIARLPNLFIGFLSIGVLGFFSLEIAKELKLQKKYLFVFITLAVSSSAYWAIFFSRVGFEAYLAQFLMTLGLFFAIKAKYNPWFLVLSSFALVFSILSYYSNRFVIFPLIILVVVYLAQYYYCLSKTKKSKDFLIALIIGVFIVTSSFIWLNSSIFYVKSQQFRLSASSVLDLQPYVLESNLVREKLDYNLFSNLIYHRRVLQLKHFIKNFNSHLSIDYLFLHGDKNLRHGTGQFGLFALSLAPLLIIGTMFTFSKSKWFFVLLLSWWILAIIPAAVPTEVPHALRSLNALTPLILFIGIGIYRLCISRKLSIHLFLNFLLLFAVIQSLIYSQDLILNYPNRSISFWQSGYNELAKTLTELSNDQTTIFVDIGDDRFFIWLLIQKLLNNEVLNMDVNHPVPKSVDNIFISNWKNLKNDHQNLGKVNYIVSKFDMFEEIKKNIEFDLDQKIIIYGEDQSPLFIVAETTGS